MSYRQTDRQTGGQTDRQTDRQTGRQTDRHTHTHTQTVVNQARVLEDPSYCGCQKSSGYVEQTCCVGASSAKPVLTPQTTSSLVDDGLFGAGYPCRSGSLFFGKPQVSLKKGQKHLNTSPLQQLSGCQSISRYFWVSGWPSRRVSDTRRCELQQMELQVHSWLREAWEGLMALGVVSQGRNP